MTLKTFGTTDLLVSSMGLGLAALGRPGYINIGHGEDLEKDYRVSAMQDRAHRVLDAAYESGIRYVDAARSYGRAEQFLGSWLETRTFENGAVAVGSKWGYIYTAGWQVDAEVHEIKEHSLPVLKRQWEETRSNLGKMPDLYQIHSATLESGVLENTRVLNALARLRETGTAVGLSASGPNQKAVIRKAMDVEVDGVRLFDSVQATWNLLEPSAGAALAAAKSRGMGIIIKEALANGRLTDRNTALDFEEQLKVLNQTALRLNTTVDALAIAAVLAQPFADVVLSGATGVGHLASNISAMSVAWDSEAATVLECLAEPADQYWQTRSNLAWK